MNGTSIFVGPGLENGVSSSLELNLQNGFINSKPLETLYIYRFLRPLPGTKLEVDFELVCQKECSLLLTMVKLTTPPSHVNFCFNLLSRFWGWVRKIANQAKADG